MTKPRLLDIAVSLVATTTLLSACTSTPHMSGHSSPVAPPSGGAPSTASSAVPGAVTSADEVTSAGGRLDVTLTASESQLPYAGTTRWAMTYNGGVAGPTLRVRPGDQMTITLVNQLTEPTSLHTHGLHVSPTQDDPFAMVAPGETATFTYDIPIDQQAGTYWYHPHVHELTAGQVAAGLSGALIVENDTDADLDAVTTDRVLVLNDPPLTAEEPTGTDSGDGTHMMGDGSMMSDHDMSGMSGGDGSGVDMMTAMRGRTGPRLLTNGQDGVALTASNGLLERAHIVNATASTSMVLAYEGAQMLRLSSSGGRLPAPVPATTIELGPGERTEVVLVPGPSGGTLTAQRLSNEGTGGPVGLPEVVATVAADAGTDVEALPATLDANTRDLFASDVEVAQRRVITLDGHMNPTIDGVAFDPGTVNFTAKKGTVEEWVIRSNSPMVHPIHLHTWPFQVEGQSGWTDVVTVPAYGEQVIRVAYDDFAGTTVLHCHILDHEDIGMMAVIKVE